MRAFARLIEYLAVVSVGLIAAYTVASTVAGNVADSLQSSADLITRSTP